MYNYYKIALADFAVVIWIFALARLLLRKIPSLADALVFITLYYNAQIPVFNILNTDFIDTFAITEYAKNSSNSAGQLLVILVSIAALYTGYYLTNTKKFAHSIRINNNKALKLFVLFVCIVLFLIYCVFSLQREGFFNSYEDPDPYALPSGTVVLFLTFIKVFGILLSLFALMNLVKRSMLINLFLITAVFFLVFIASYSGKRLEVLMSVSTVFVIYYVEKIKPLLRLIIVVVALFGLMSIGVSRMGGELSSKNVAVLPLLEGFFSNHSFVGYYELLDKNKISYEYGIKFAQSIGAFVPRFLLPNKEELLYANYGMLTKEVAPLGGNSLLADLYLQGGLPSCILFYLFLGFFFKKIQLNNYDLKQIYQKKSVSLKIPIYIITLTIFITHMRDGMVTAIKTYLQVIVVLYIFYLFLKKWNY